MKRSGDESVGRFFSRNRELWFVLVVALVTRGAAVLPVHAAGYTSDEREYIVMSRGLAQGGEFIDSNGERSTRAPLFPYVLSVLERWFGTGHAIPHAIGCLLGTVAVLLCYHLSIMLWGNKSAALIAAGMMAVYPGLVIYAGLLQTETLYIVLMMTTILFSYRWIADGGLLNAIIFATGAALAALTRAVFFGFIPLLFLLVVWMRRKAGVKKIEVIVAFIVCASTLSPWMIRNFEMYHALVPVSSGGGNSLLTGNNPFASGTWNVGSGFDEWYREQAAERGVPSIESLNEVEKSTVSGAIARDYILHHPWETLQRALKKAHVFLVYPIAHSDSNVPVQMMAVGFDILLLAGGAVGFVSRMPSRRSFLIIGAACLFFFLVQVVLHAEARFRLPLVPLVCLFFGWGASLVADRVRRQEFFTSGPVRRKLVLFAVVLALVYGWTGWLFLRGFL